MEKCFFCEITKNTHCILTENKSFYAHFSHVPVNPGHIELFPKRHLNTILDLNNEELNDMQTIMKQLINLLNKYDFKDLYMTRIKTSQLKEVVTYSKIMCKLKHINQKPTGYNIGINQGHSAGQTVMHLHIHIIPRFDNDVDNPTGGVRNFMNDLGDYKKYL